MRTGLPGISGELRRTMRAANFQPLTLASMTSPRLRPASLIAGPPRSTRRREGARPRSRRRVQRASRDALRVTEPIHALVDVDQGAADLVRCQLVARLVTLSRGLQQKGSG